MSTVQAIVHATTTLSQIKGVDREALLLTHRKELESAFHNLQTLLQPVVSPASSPVTFPDVPTASTCTSSNASDTPEETFVPRDILSANAIHGASEAVQAAGDTHEEVSNNIPRQVEALINGLEKRENEILKYQPAQSDCFATNLASEDPRIVQISHMDSTTLDKKFQSGLSALSLADEYTEWESQFIGTTRVDTLLRNLKSASDRKDSAYKEYVNSSDHFKDKARAQKYIEHGVKFRVFEGIYLARVEVTTHDIKPETHLGVLGLLFFIFNQFRRLKYDYLPMLANAILASKLRDHAEALCQSVFDCFESHKSRMLDYRTQFLKQVLASDGTEKRKRRRLERFTSPSHVTSQNTPRAQFPDLFPLEHTQILSSQDPFALQNTATVPWNSQNALPDLVPLENSRGVSFRNLSFSQDTPIPDLYPIEIGLPQDIEAEVRNFVSNLDPKNCVNMTPLPLNHSHASVYNPL